MLVTENMDVFKLAHALTLEIYRIVANFPADERYGLSSQMKRAAVSINSNIMEGSARKTPGEKNQFIGIARGSASELKYHIILAKDLELVELNKAEKLIAELNRVLQMLSGMMKIKSNPNAESESENKGTTNG